MRPLAGAFGDVVPNDRAVQVVAAPMLGELRQADALHDPECFDVGDVVEHESGDGEGFEVGQTGRAGQVAELGILRNEREGDHAVEACGRVGGSGFRVQ